MSNKMKTETPSDDAPKLYFSASTGGFYHSVIHARPGQPSKIPEDAVEISQDEHTRLLTEHYKGDTIITADKDGKPVLAPRPPDPDEVVLQRVRSKRDRILKESDFSQFPDSPFSEAKRAEWRAYRQKLRDLPKNSKKPASIQFPDAPGA